MLGLNTCICSVLLDACIQLFIAHLAEFRAGQHLRGIGYDADLLGDSRSGITVIARYHDGADTCRAALANRFYGLGSNRVNHADDADKGQVLLEEGRGHACRTVIPCAHGGSERAKRIIRHGLIIDEYPFADSVGHRHGLFSVKVHGAALEQLIRRTLGELNNIAVEAVDGGHQLSYAVKGSFAYTRILLLELALIKPYEGRKVDERTFGGFADCDVVFIGLRIRAEAHGGA